MAIENSGIARSHKMRKVTRATAVLGLTVIILFSARTAPAYSVLTHEQVVDFLWIDQIVPLLKHRFPQVTEEDLRVAHAFAYGGSMIQDMGYYPFGNKFFSDLLHYVRTGDFVDNLIHDSSTLNEYAFALGALAHYSSDNAGHPTVNHVVPIEFPQLRKKWGDIVTYADDPKAHIRTEFGFDMVQVAKNRYTSDQYHDFIGFEISQDLLERTFKKTYGLNLNNVLKHEELAIGTFRWSVSRVVPEMTRIALLSRRDEMVKEDPNFDEKKFLFYMSRAKYESQWGSQYRRPGFGARVLAVLLKVLPKVGPFKAASFKIPTQQGEKLYVSSIDHTVESYAAELRKVEGHSLHLDNLDCDTGRPTEPGEYALSDKTYAKLVDKLANRHFDHVPDELRADLLQYFVRAKSPLSGRRKQRRWAKARRKLKSLREANAVALDGDSAAPSLRSE